MCVIDSEQSAEEGSVAPWQDSHLSCTVMADSTESRSCLNWTPGSSPPIKGVVDLSVKKHSLKTAAVQEMPVTLAVSSVWYKLCFHTTQLHSRLLLEENTSSFWGWLWLRWWSRSSTNCKFGESIPDSSCPSVQVSSGPELLRCICPTVNVRNEFLGINKNTVWMCLGE